MVRMIIKFVIYYAVLVAFLAIGWLPEATALTLLGAAAVLAVVNTFIRPLLVSFALPFNIILFGIASVFANLLAVVIANGIMGGVMTAGFWVMLLIALVIMLLDDAVRNIRQAIKKHAAAENECETSAGC
jgi:putative membrane protein